MWWWWLSKNPINSLTFTRCRCPCNTTVASGWREWLLVNSGWALAVASSIQWPRKDPATTLRLIQQYTNNRATALICLDARPTEADHKEIHSDGVERRSCYQQAAIWNDRLTAALFAANMKCERGIFINRNQHCGTYILVSLATYVVKMKCCRKADADGVGQDVKDTHEAEPVRYIESEHTLWMYQEMMQTCKVKVKALFCRDKSWNIGNNNELWDKNTNKFCNIYIFFELEMLRMDDETFKGKND